MKVLTYYGPRPDDLLSIHGIKAWNLEVQETSRLDTSLWQHIDKVKTLTVKVPIIKYKLLALVIHLISRVKLLKLTITRVRVRIRVRLQSYRPPSPTLSQQLRNMITPSHDDNAVALSQYQLRSAGVCKARLSSREPSLLLSVVSVVVSSRLPYSLNSFFFFFFSSAFLASSSAFFCLRSSALSASSHASQSSVLR